MTTEIPVVPKFSYDEVKAERDRLLEQSRQDAAKIWELEKDLDHYKGVAKALELRYGGRGTIDLREEEMIPLWVRNLDLSRSQQWHITVHLRLTCEASLLASYLENLSISPAIFGSKIERLYHLWGKDYHRQKLSVPKDDSGWETLFHSLDITEKLEKESIRALFDYDSVPKELQKRQSRKVTRSKVDCRGFVLIKNIAWRAKTAEIQLFLESLSITVHDIVMLMTEADDRVPLKAEWDAGILVE